MSAGARIKIRRDVAANWGTVNPVLADGEFGWAKDVRQLKLGDGTTAWNSLPNLLTPTGIVTSVQGRTGAVDITADVQAIMAADPSVAAAAASAVSAQLSAAGVMNAAQAPALATNRVLDPQTKTSGGVAAPASMTLARITTGLPAGFAFGIQSTRTGSLTSVIAQLYAGSQSSTDPLRIPVTPAEVVTGSAMVWTDQAAARARVDLVFYTAAGAVVSTLAGTYSNIAQNTWEQRTTTVTVPATAAYCLVQAVIATQSGNTVTGAVAKATAYLLYSGTVTAPVYADGTSVGWAWSGTAHASVSKKVLLALGEFETPAGAQARVDAHVAAANPHPGYLLSSVVPSLAQNDALDPQLNSAGGSGNAGNYPITRITTGLPTGFAFGAEATRQGTLSGTIAQLFYGSSSSASSQRWLCVAGETLTFASYLWTDRPAARARVDVAFYDATGTLLSSVTGTYSNIAQNTWEQRVAAGLVAPANTAYAVLTGTVSEQSGVTTIAGAKVRMTGGILVRGNVPAPVYGDGTFSGWTWTGVAHASSSRKLFLSPAEMAAAAGAFTLTKSGNVFTMARAFAGTKTLVQSMSLVGSGNGAFGLLATSLDGVVLHTTSDDVCPIRTQMGTVGADHGYSNVATFTNPDGKTAADLGSVWADGAGRQYVLLGFTVEATPKLIIGGDYTVDGSGVVNSANVAPTSNLTHVSGATHTGAIVYTTAVASSLLPSIGRVTTTVWADGKPVTVDGSQTCHELVVRESYAILDYASIYDTAKANIGVSYTTLTASIAGCVRVSNIYRWTASGCRVSTSLTELKPTNLGQCGAVQSAIMDTTGTGGAITRYLPGVGVLGGFNWANGVDMTAYSTDLIVTTAQLITAGKVPSVSIDVLSVSGSTLIGFVMGYLPYGARGDELSRATNRLTHAATKLWDLRGTKKNYPTFTTSELAGWGHVQAESFRGYIDPTQVAATLASKGDVGSVWEALSTASDLRA